MKKNTSDIRMIIRLMAAILAIFTLITFASVSVHAYAGGTDNAEVKIVEIEDNEVPLTVVPGVEDGAKLNLSWLLVFIVIAAGVDLYEKSREDK